LPAVAASNGHARPEATPKSPASPAPSVKAPPQSAKVNDRALERIEDLLRALVTRKASDLHLRVA
jgi:hypothetical protein